MDAICALHSWVCFSSPAYFLALLISFAQSRQDPAIMNHSCPPKWGVILLLSHKADPSCQKTLICMDAGLNHPYWGTFRPWTEVVDAYWSILIIDRYQGGLSPITVNSARAWYNLIRPPPNYERLIKKNWGKISLSWQPAICQDKWLTYFSCLCDIILTWNKVRRVVHIYKVRELELRLLVQCRFQSNWLQRSSIYGLKIQICQVRHAEQHYSFMLW